MKSGFGVLNVLLWLGQLSTFSFCTSGVDTLSPEDIFHKIKFDRLLVECLISEVSFFIPIHQRKKLDKHNSLMSILPSSNLHWLNPIGLTARFVMGKGILLTEVLFHHPSSHNYFPKDKDSDSQHLEIPDIDRCYAQV